MRYVDGYVLCVPTKSMADYRRLASKAGKIWMELGALQYCECVGDDLQTEFGLPFPKLAKPRPGETIIFAFVVYKSRAHRDKVNALVMKDPRLAEMPKKMPFDPKRMAYGGFKTLVDL